MCIRNILYVSYDGLTDPVADSQVIPYLIELTKRGHRILILSFEKPAKEALIAGVSEKLAPYGIEWIRTRYTKKPPVISTVRDVKRGLKLARKIITENKIDLIHARSYISALLAIKLKKKTPVPFVFDMRGFWVDERVDGGLWSLKNPLYKSIYKWFKKKEKQLLAESAHIVSLTYNAKEILETQFGIDPEKISVIACAADYDLFDPEKISGHEKMALRKELGISENTFILFYHGSLGTWYLGEKMLDFYENLLKTKPDSVFLLVVNDFPVSLQKSVQQRGLGDKIILRQKLPRQRIPLYLSLANLCIMFIKPVFSKTASSPIKYAESLAMNKPVLANIGVGDMAELADNDWGFLVKQLTQSEYQDAIRALSAFNNRQIRRQSKSSYLLSSGVEKYDDVYAKTCKVLL